MGIIPLYRNLAKANEWASERLHDLESWGQPAEELRIDLAEVGYHGSVIHSVEIAPVDRDGLVMTKPLFATTL